MLLVVSSVVYCLIAVTCNHFQVFWLVDGQCLMFFLIVIEGESYGAAVWQIPELYGQLNSPQLERIASLDAHVGKIKW